MGYSGGDIVNIDFGNSFRMVNVEKLIDLVKKDIISWQDLGVFVALSNYIKPYSTEISVSKSQFARKLGKQRSYIGKIINKLITNNLIVEYDGKLFLSLDYVTRGAEVYKHVYDICDCSLEVKQNFKDIGIASPILKRVPDSERRIINKAF